MGLGRSEITMTRVACVVAIPCPSTRGTRAQPRPTVAQALTNADGLSGLSPQLVVRMGDGNMARSEKVKRLEQISSSILGAAGEHYIMCQLLRRGRIAALAPAGVPNTDLVVTDKIGDKLCAVQVKVRREIGSD